LIANPFHFTGKKRRRGEKAASKRNVHVGLDEVPTKRARRRGSDHAAVRRVIDGLKQKYLRKFIDQCFRENIDRAICFHDDT
jgi:hypothetical protein